MRTDFSPRRLAWMVQFKAPIGAQRSQSGKNRGEAAIES